MSRGSATIKNKISPLIEGQVPDFIQADHPKFVDFLTSYYQFLEAAEMSITAGIDNLTLEFETPTYVLDQEGDKVILESGTGTTGKFEVGETVQGDSSLATGKVLVQDTDKDAFGNSKLFITSNQKFEDGENLSGLTSGANAKLLAYKANPIQTIQQFLDYADVDNTIYKFLDEFQYQFMNAIPSTLASGTSKRNLLKNIKQLYTAKGTSEGHKLFMRMLLDEEVDMIYPNKFMLRLSDGLWTTKTIVRVTASAGSVGTELVGSMITGLTSGATAVVVNSTSAIQNNISVTELELATSTITGTFEQNEQIKGLSQTRDIILYFTIKGIITSGPVTNKGILNSDNDVIDTDSSIGNGFAAPRIDDIFTGSVDEVFIETKGTGYKVGDVLSFTTTQSNTATAQGFVSAVGGGIEVETGTIVDGTDEVNAGDVLTLEDSTHQSLVEFRLGLETETGTGGFVQESGNAASYTDGINTEAGLGDDIKLEKALEILSMDSFGTANDMFLLEPETFDNLSVSNEKGQIRKVFLKNGGAGYKFLPTITISSNNGTGAALFASTDTIGGAAGIKMADTGFDYSEAPTANFRANIIIKNISGTFAVNNTLTTHHGTVRNINLPQRVLTVSIDRDNGFDLESGDDILLEDGNFLTLENKHQLYQGNSITDSGGASATIHHANKSEGSVAHTVVHTDIGYYDSFRSKLGEDTVRIQDSYYYQDFSYEVQAGAAASEYMSELKRALHPAGFEAFGKVSLASLVSAAIHDRSAGSNVPDFDTDTFSPILASAIVTLFTTVFGRRLGTAEQNPNQQANPMRGYDVPEAQGNDILTAGARDVTLTNYFFTKIDIVEDTPFVRNRGRTALTYLNTNPFGGDIGETGIQLEDGTVAQYPQSVIQSESKLLLDGVLDDLDNVPGAGQQVGDVGSVMMMEDDVNVNNGVSLAEVGTLTFDNILTSTGQIPDTVWTTSNTALSAYPAEIFVHSSGDLMLENEFTGPVLDEEGNRIDLEAGTFYEPFGPHPSPASSAERFTFDADTDTTFDETSITFDRTAAI